VHFERYTSKLLAIDMKKTTKEKAVAEGEEKTPEEPVKKKRFYYKSRTKKKYTQSPIPKF